MPATPKTTAKADVMKDAAASKTIEADVDCAARDFEELQTNLNALLTSLKEQHEAILALNEKRLKAASNFEVFVADTPIHKVAGVFNLEEVKASIFKVELTEPGLEDSQGHDSALEDAQTLETEEEPHSEHSKDEASNEEEEASAEEKEPSTMVDLDEEIESEEAEKKEAAVLVKEAPAPSSEPSLAGKSSVASIPEDEFKIQAPFKTAPPEFFDIEDSFAAVRQTSYKLTKMYADQYNEQIIQYVEGWQKITKDRVTSRLMEYEKHKKDLSHYREKVEKLQENADKKEANNKALSKRETEKLERNKLKLNGKREAHDAYGESLFLLMEEVNQRAWKDVLPVLLRTLEFDLNHTRDEAKVCSKFGRTFNEAKRIGAEYGISPAGRMHELKTQKPEALYTGEREVATPSIKSPHRAQ